MRRIVLPQRSSRKAGLDDMPNKMIEEAEEIFGNMRDATPEEQQNIDEYIKSISTPTGVNLFDLLEDDEEV